MPFCILANGCNSFIHSFKVWLISSLCSFFRRKCVTVISWYEWHMGSSWKDRTSFNFAKQKYAWHSVFWYYSSQISFARVMWLFCHWLWWQYFIWMGFFVLVRCGPQGTSSNKKSSISLALLSSAKVFNVAAQVSQQVEKDVNAWKHENTLTWMSSFLPFYVFLSSFLIGVFL